jgi:hypothetical protein
MCAERAYTRAHGQKGPTKVRNWALGNPQNFRVWVLPTLKGAHTAPKFEVTPLIQSHCVVCKHKDVIDNWIAKQLLF